MKIVVAGGGFISSHLVKRLEKEGNQVKVIHHTDKPKKIKANCLFYLFSYGNHYHQKALLSSFKANLIDYYKLICDNDCIVVYFSTSSVILPVQTHYSTSKYLGERLGLWWAKKFKKPIIVIRPYSVYGPGEADFRFIPTVCKSLIKGENLRICQAWHDWIYIDDLIDGVLTALKNIRRTAGKIVPVGTGKHYSNFSILERLRKISGKEVKLEKMEKRPYDNKGWVANSSFLRSMGWKPKHSIDEGLKKTFEFYKKKYE